MTIGEKIRKLRKHAGFTQRALGKLSGTSETTIKQYESGKRQPRIEQLKKIAKVFDFPLYLLLDDTYDLENVELEMKRARPFKSYEMSEPSKPFTVSFSQYKNKNSSIHTDSNLQNLFKIAIRKFQNKGDLTYEEEQVITEYVESDLFEQEIEDIKQIAKKAYSYILYEHSHSYASSAERLKEDAEARKILEKYESGEKILESEYKMVIEYHNRMMERSKLLQDWLEWYKSTCEPLNNEGRKKVAEYAGTLAETDKYTKPKEGFQGRMMTAEIDNAVKACLNDDTPPDPPEE